MAHSIKADLKEKIVLLSGPRQSGKTTLAKSLYENNDYINYDSSEDRRVLQEKSWDRKQKLIIFDEIHKMKKWKSYIKGIYDTEGVSPQLLVTGSARLDAFRKTGDSLAGRYFRHRLHPFDMKEFCRIDASAKPEEVFDTLLNMGGFPEPFLKNSKTYYNRWKISHIDIILRQDLIDFSAVRNITSIETLVDMLRIRVGSTISYASLARDLQVDAKTIKVWLLLLEDLFVIFKVMPFHRNVARSILKEPKYYFFDNGLVIGDNGAKLENLVACALFKELNYLEDSHGSQTALHFLRTKDKKEIDFYIESGESQYMIEVKWADTTLSKNFMAFDKYFVDCQKIQLVKECKREKTFQNGSEVRRVIPWLKNLDLL